MAKTSAIELGVVNDCLEGTPDTDELKRLVKYYPTYKLNYRAVFLEGFFNGDSYPELVAKKLSAKGIESPLTDQEKGGHGKWARSKAVKVLMRLLYLRFRLDKGMTRRQANREILSLFPPSAPIYKASKQSTIRKNTSSKVLDL